MRSVSSSGAGRGRRSPTSHDASSTHASRQAKVRTGRWHCGTNLVERLLGRELCVLAWAAERASEDELPVIGSKWAALRPEERWWLFMVTVAEAGGLPDDHERGWRRALHLALADAGEETASNRRRRPVEPDLFRLPTAESKT